MHVRNASIALSLLLLIGGGAKAQDATIRPPPAHKTTGETAKSAGPNDVDVCTGEHEERCPPHKKHFGCPNRPREAIAKEVCSGEFAEILILGTRSGDRCGYAMLQVTCSHAK